MSFEINYNRVHQVYQFHQHRLANTYDGCQSPKANTLPGGLIWRTSSKLDKIKSKFAHNNKEVIDREKRIKTLNEVTTVKNINKNPQRLI